MGLKGWKLLSCLVISTVSCQIRNAASFSDGIAGESNKGPTGNETKKFCVESCLSGNVPTCTQGNAPATIF